MMRFERKQKKTIQRLHLLQYRKKLMYSFKNNSLPLQQI